MIDTQIRAETMEIVYRQILYKFPCLDFSDDDGFGAGQGFVELKYKMINRNNYLNRFKDSQAAATKPVMSLKKSRNTRAGTIKQYWEKTSKECDKDTLSKLKRNESLLLTDAFLFQSQAFVRYRLDEKINAARIISQLPVIRRRILLNYHFEKATGKSVSVFRHYFASKRDKIIQYSLTCRNNLHLVKTSTDLAILKLLCCLVGENFDELVLQKQIGTRIDDITVCSAGPVLISSNCLHSVDDIEEQLDMPDKKRMKIKEAKRRNAIDGFKRMDLFLTNYIPEQHQHEVALRLERVEKI
ncbi:uncharacterized protein LOC135697898 [Ochlerotatus camptorhynchus]|uniref:uncharacterized protein LOC135697898 n=1 Tax=Ochlerotatus camptorhynchus TaxID=644619 RepID=UPI0031DBDE32